MGTFTTITTDDIRETTTVLNQLVDFVEEDVSGSATRKKFQVFVTSSGANAITSSLFHTVFDQNFTLQTANELFDMTMGFYPSSDLVTQNRSEIDANLKNLFPAESLMMREKVNIYRQYAQLLLGGATERFTAPFTQTTVNAFNNIDEALFIHFKRLFIRDGVKRETFAMRMFQSSSVINETTNRASNVVIVEAANRRPIGSKIFTDVGSSTSLERSRTGGDVGNIVNASNTAETVGLMFYQQGIAVLDMKKVFDANQIMSGTIKSVGSSATATVSGSFIRHFLVSGSIDEVLNHVTETRFGSGSVTALTFQNNTKINSTLYFCRATADDFNFSTNPTFTDTSGRIKVIGSGQENVEKSFAFITTVGLYDSSEELLAVAKLSRPVEKNDEKDLTFRVRLDF
jgi:hypothetical protein